MNGESVFTSKILHLLIALLLVLSGCAKYTYSEYRTQYVYEIRAGFETGLKEDDDSMIVCFNMNADRIARELTKNLRRCLEEEAVNRPYEMTESQLRVYMRSDVICARNAFVKEYMDAIDLNKIPAKYMDRCVEYKTFFKE